METMRMTFQLESGEDDSLVCRRMTVDPENPFLPQTPAHATLAICLLNTLQHPDCFCAACQMVRTTMSILHRPVQDWKKSGDDPGIHDSIGTTAGNA